MHRITRSIGSAHADPVIDTSKEIIIRKVLIIRPNHRLGNQLLLTPIVQDVINTFPNCEIELFVKGGVAVPVFENYKHINKIIQLPKKPFDQLFKYVMVWVSIRSKRYDLVINGDKDSSSGRLLTALSKANFKVFGDIHEDIQNTYPDHMHIAKYPVYGFRRYLTKLGFKENASLVPTLNIKLNDEEIAKGKSILDAIVKNNKKTICLFTNATGAKCYSEAWWESLYSRMLKAYPNHNIIEMLPIENISKINFKAPHFYSKDIREMGGILANTAVFVAADNGVMHLASASQVPTVGFFSVTNKDVYRPYGNGSIAIDTNTNSTEDIIKQLDKILEI